MTKGIFSMPILLIDDEPHILKGLEILLKTEGYTNVSCCSKSAEAMILAQKIKPSVIVTDLLMPGLTGENLIDLFSAALPDVPIVVVTGVQDIEVAVRCVQKGAHDYITKPVDENRFLTTLKNASSFYIMRTENERLRESVLSEQVKNPQIFSSIITDSEKMYAIFKYIEAIADSPCPVLITGETGSGKEYIARCIHDAGKRSGKFTAFNAAGVDDTMFSDTLFGHEKGAFTGADSRRKGLVEDSSGGTLFLDEIGDLVTQSQIKLLRLIQEQKYYAVGSDIPRNSSARIVAATNIPAESLRDSETFRSDLFYRLHVHHIHVPALRERREDIPLLADFFAAQAASEYNCAVPEIEERVYNLLMSYQFPGNIRELKSVIFDAIAEFRGEKLVSSMLKGLGISESHSVQSDSEFLTLEQIEKNHIHTAMVKCSWNQTEAARLLGISRQTLNKKLKTIKSE